MTTEGGGGAGGEADEPPLVRQLAAECNRLRAQRDAYARAVRFYAEAGAYRPGPGGGPSAAALDGGARARNALLVAAAAGRVTSI